MNAVDIAARGLAARALKTGVTQATSSGASSIGTADGGNVQEALDKAAGRPLIDAAAADLDATGEVEQVHITDRGLYRKTAIAPTPTELARGFAFTDAGGKSWAKPADRICRAGEYGIVAHESFDEDGVFVGTPVDQAPLLQDLLYRIKEKGGGTLRFDGQQGAIPLGSSIIVPFGVDLDGVSAGFTPWGSDYLGGLRFMPTEDGQYFDAAGVPRSVAKDGHCQSGILFWANIDPQHPNTWMQAYSGTGSGTFRNLNIDGQMTDGIKGFRFAGSYRFKDIRTFKVSTLIEKPNLYVDRVTIESIESLYRANATDFLIDLPGLGDAIWISGVESGFLEDAGIGVTMGINLGATRSAVLSGVINGIHRIVGASGVLILPAHVEGGYWELDRSDVTLKGGVLYNGKGAPQAPVVIKNSEAANLATCRVTLDDVMFHHTLNPFGSLGGWGDTQLLDIDLQTARATLVMNGGNRRRCTVSGQVSVSWQTAPTIGDSTNGGAFANWKNYAPMLATAPITIMRQSVPVTGTMPNRAISWNGLSVLNFTPVEGVGGVTYKGPTGDNTYLARPLCDPVRLIGREATFTRVVTIAVVNGSNTLPGFRIDATDATRGAVMWEVLRDTGNDGNYDKRTLVPGIDLDHFVDDGNAVNSFAWEEYGPGAPPSLNNNALPVRADYHNGQLTLLDSIVGAPIAGTWTTGDHIYRPTSVPDANGMKLDGVMCRTGGTPGTWDSRYVSTVSPAV